MDAIGWNEVFDGGLWVRVGASLLCGGIIGLERQLRGKPAGIRTSVLICMGTTLYLWLSLTLDQEKPGGDPSRVMGQVVTGVGFLGGGVILTHGGLVKGVTSAAVVWVLAAIGCAIGLGHIAVAVALSIVTVLVLVGVEQLEHAYKGLRRGVHAAGAEEEGAAVHTVAGEGPTEG